MARTLLLTGATSGIGRAFVEHVLMHEGSWRLIATYRDGTAWDMMMADLLARGFDRRIEGVKLDLASLASVRTGADEIVRELAGGRLDAVVLNAGLMVSAGDRRSADGHELTFAVNHLGHRALLDRLWDHLVPEVRIVWSADGRGEPGAGGFPRFAPAKWQIPEALADVRRSQDHETAARRRAEARYSAAKMANMMAALRLGRRFAAEKRPGTSVAFDPGTVAGTRLLRGHGLLTPSLMGVLLPRLARLVPGVRTPRAAAEDLAWVATNMDAQAFNAVVVQGRYARMPGGPVVDEALQNELWAACDGLVQRRGDVLN